LGCSAAAGVVLPTAAPVFYFRRCVQFNRFADDLAQIVIARVLDLVPGAAAWAAVDLSAGIADPPRVTASAAAAAHPACLVDFVPSEHFKIGWA